MTLDVVCVGRRARQGHLPRRQYLPSLPAFLVSLFLPAEKQDKEKMQTMQKMRNFDNFRGFLMITPWSPLLHLVL